MSTPRAKRGRAQQQEQEEDDGPHHPNDDSSSEAGSDHEHDRDVQQRGEEEDMSQDDEEEERPRKRAKARKTAASPRRGRGRGRGKGRGKGRKAAEPEGEPLTAAVKKLRELAPHVDEPEAVELLHMELSDNPQLQDAIYDWVDAAMVRLACQQEDDAEAEQLRQAMAESLVEKPDPEELKKARQREEGRVQTCKADFGHLSVWQHFSKLICPVFLLASSAGRAFENLLAYERRCKQWYSGRGTYVYYDTMAQELCGQLKPQLSTALQQSNLTRPHSTTHTLACIQPPVTCPHCCTAGTGQQPDQHAEGNGTPQVQKQQQDGHVQGGEQAAGTPEHQDEAGGSAGASQSPAKADELLVCTAEDVLAKNIGLACFFTQLDEVLSEKKRFIEQEVAKMPEGGGDPAGVLNPGGAANNSSGGGAAAAAADTLAHVPQLFRLPPGMSAVEEVMLSSDDDE